MPYYTLLPAWAWILILFAGIAGYLFLDSRPPSFWDKTPGAPEREREEV